MAADDLIERARTIPEDYVRWAEPDLPIREDDEVIGEVPPEARRLFAVAFSCLSCNYYFPFLEKEEQREPRKAGRRYKQLAWDKTLEHFNLQPDIRPQLRVRKGWLLVLSSKPSKKK